MPVGIPSHNAAPLTSASPHRSFLQRLTSFFVRLFECYTPDPYILAVGLTILTGVLAALFAPKESLPIILTGWYAGLFSILAFAFQVSFDTPISDLWRHHGHHDEHGFSRCLC